MKRPILLYKGVKSLKLYRCFAGKLLPFLWVYLNRLFSCIWSCWNVIYLRCIWPKTTETGAQCFLSDAGESKMRNVFSDFPWPSIMDSEIMRSSSRGLPHLSPITSTASSHLKSDILIISWQSLTANPSLPRHSVSNILEKYLDRRNITLNQHRIDNWTAWYAFKYNNYSVIHFDESGDFPVCTFGYGTIYMD